MSVLELKNVSKSFGKKTVVDNVSSCIEQGEIFGFLGPNGAGKTTTIKMITRLLSHTKGKITICGYDVSKNFEKAMENVGVIIENPEVYDYMSGLDNLKVLSSVGGKVSKERYTEISNQVGLSLRIKDKVKKYSLGMRQRLGIAQALINRPKLLILDEPTNGLDPSGIKELRDMLKRLSHEEGLAVMVSSHLLSEMELMCDRYAILDAGRVISVNTIGEQKADDENTPHIYCIETDDIERAKAVLRGMYGDVMDEEKTMQKGLLVINASRRDLLGVNNALFSQGVNIYTITKNEETLEEKFLAATEEYEKIKQVR